MDVNTIDIYDRISKNQMIYATIGGSRLYGWSDDSSDVDAHGCFVYPLNHIISLHKPRDVINYTLVRDTPVDLVFFEIEKELNLIISNNINVYEQLFSPHVLMQTSRYNALVSIAKKCLSKKITNGCMGLAVHNYNKYIQPFITSEPSSIPAKKFLYVMRALMAGIYTLNTGVIESNIHTLNGRFGIKDIDHLIEVKKSKYGTNGLNYNRIDRTIHELMEEIKAAEQDSKLPCDNTIHHDEVNQFLIKTRMVYS